MKSDSSYWYKCIYKMVHMFFLCVELQVLVDAVNFGVIPIVYEYEGTTLESLMSQLELCLQGRNAKLVLMAQGLKLM